MNKLSILLGIWIAMTASIKAQPYPSSRELRAVWIATVANIDWPSRSGLSSIEQQQEFISILDLHKSIGMNAIVMQIRPSADAFYPSPFEPWSSWLTGKLGQSPQPYYDPLEFMIRETHSRGMEFHAWINPYRALIRRSDSVKIDSASLVFKHPSWFVRYGKTYYFDPGLPEVREHLIKVINDVVSRYDIDAIHFDDYFYPYKINGEIFDDSTTYVKYNHDRLSIDDWRRSNVDQLIEQVHLSIKSNKSEVKFGISPFGVWRNKIDDPSGSETKAGQTCYDDLYADVIKWAKNGWVDYIAPQLYWPIGHDKAPFEVLLDWWNRNSYGVPIYTGLAFYRIEKTDTLGLPIGLFQQMKLEKNYRSVNGNIFFSSKWFNLNHRGATDTLKTIYSEIRNVPSSPSIENKLRSPHIRFVCRKSINLYWAVSDYTNYSRSRPFLVYRRDESSKEKEWRLIGFVPNDPEKLSSGQISYEDTTAKKGKHYTYTVTTLDKHNKESPAVYGFGVKNMRTAWQTMPLIALQTP